MDWTKHGVPFSFLGCIFPSFSLGSDALLGEIEERKHDDSEVLDALVFAMNEFNAMQNDLYTKEIPQFCIAHLYCAQFYAWLARAHKQNDGFFYTA